MRVSKEMLQIFSTMLRRKTKYEIYFHIQQYSTTIYHYGKDFCHFFFLFPDAYSVYLHHSPYSISIAENLLFHTVQIVPKNIASFAIIL